MSREELDAIFAEPEPVWVRFLDVFLDRGALWLLVGVSAVALVVVGVQVGIASVTP